MAYGLKYRSIFYNIFGTQVTVGIYKEDYVGSVTDVRTQEVKIEVNYQDEDTAIIGRGVTVSIVADSIEMTQYEDLLTALEKQFQCIIEYGSRGVVFIGYSLCDLNERQFLPYAIVTLQFTDYLRRLEDVRMPVLGHSSGISSIIDMVSEAIDVIEEADNATLLVNSTLFEDRMDQTSADTFLAQTYLNNYVFYSSPTEYDDSYAALNKALLSFGAYMYSYDSRWVIERLEDALRDETWVRYAGMGVNPTGESWESQKQLLNKQDDFEYINCSQVIAYESGLKTLELNLKDKQIDSFIYNDYDIATMIPVADTTPNPGTLEYQTWYYYEDAQLAEVNYNYRGMSSYVKWTYETGSDCSMWGLYYAFQVQFPEIIDDPVELSISYKMSIGVKVPYGYTVRIPFALRVDGGPLDGHYIWYDWATDTGELFIHSTQTFNYIDTVVDKVGSYVYSADYTFNLTDKITNDGPVIVTEKHRMWDLLGNPTTQKFMIYFYPMQLVMVDPADPLDSPYRVPYEQYLGDIVVKLTDQTVPNKYTYYINADFERTEEIDIDFFDLDNQNFVNGPMIVNDSSGEYERTATWISNGETTPISLMNLFAKHKFRNYARTIHRLKGTIRYDGYIKPFAVLTDDNMQVDSVNVQFVLQSYIWDLNNGTYDIDAQEYTNVDILLETEATDSSGGIDYEGDPGVVPPVPTGLNVAQTNPGQGVYANWNPSTGASGYRLQRRPYYDSIAEEWLDDWLTVYEGSSISYYDPIQNEVIPDDGTEFYYHVLAKTTLVTSTYSAEDSLLWANT